MCDEYPLFALAETTKSCVKKVRLTEPERTKTQTERTDEDSEKESIPLLRRFSNGSLKKLRDSFRKLNCLEKQEEEETVPMMDEPQRKSIDIGVGFARRASMFLFTRRSAVHPYHPFTPKQTVRKIYHLADDK